MKWETKRLDELGIVARGKSKHRPRNDPSLYGGRYPFIQTAEVKSANMYITEYKQTYNDKGLLQSKIWDSGTLCITIAANIADTAILTFPACFPDSIIGFIPYEGIADTRYIKYCFDLMQQNFKQISQGATQDNLSLEKLATIKFPVPDLKLQQRIADILSTYDDLIENNQKQIKLLEEAAMRLYKEWFVKLRFPGYENTKIVDGVPEGWRLGRVSELAEFKRGKTITKKNAKDGNVPVVAGGLEPAYFHNVANTVAPVITISASGANAGYTRLYNTDIWASDCSYIDASYGDKLYFIYTFLKNNKEVIDNLQRGAAQPHVYAKDINALSTYIPESTIMEPFCNLVAPLFKKIAVQERLISELKQARDKLLPKLMSGEIEV